MRPLLLLAALAVPVAAWACDPAEMEAAMTEICRGATDGAREAIAAAQGAATPAEAGRLAAELHRLHELCAAGDPAQAARGAALLARAAGRIEARHASAATL